MASIFRNNDSPGNTDKKSGIRSSILYPGSKGGSGVYQTIINTIPPHKTYIETHFGGGSIMRHKLPAPAGNIGLDIDPEVIEYWLNVYGDVPGYIFKNVNACCFLKSYPFTGTEFVYADPPYLMETRKGGKLYNFEYTTEQHIELLNCLQAVPSMVMVSGYWSELYTDTLAAWNSKSFEAQTRQGKTTEWIWYNYPEPDQLHDYSFLGDSFRERERIKRKKTRWINKILKMPAVERNGILQGLNEACNTISPALERSSGIAKEDER